MPDACGKSLCHLCSSPQNVVSRRNPVLVGWAELYQGVKLDEMSVLVSSEQVQIWLASHGSSSSQTKPFGSLPKAFEVHQGLSLRFPNLRNLILYKGNVCLVFTFPSQAAPWIPW